MKTGVRYQAYPGLVLGFHGTDKKTAESVLAGKAELEPSANQYDWLGHGIYFWNTAQRELGSSPMKKSDAARSLHHR